jgi:hypothetical protein
LVHLPALAAPWPAGPGHKGGRAHGDRVGACIFCKAQLKSINGAARLHWRDVVDLVVILNSAIRIPSNIITKYDIFYTRKELTHF